MYLSFQIILEIMNRINHFLQSAMEFIQYIIPGFKTSPVTYIDNICTCIFLWPSIHIAFSPFPLLVISY